MAGGIGSRFWPMSKQNYKTIFDILGTGETLIQQTFKRLLRLCLTENIFIVTNREYKDLCLKQLKNVIEDNILCEPVAEKYCSLYCICSFLRFII